MPALCQALSKGVPPVPSYAKEGAGVVLPEAISATPPQT